MKNTTRKEMEKKSYCEKCGQEIEKVAKYLTKGNQYRFGYVTCTRCGQMVPDETKPEIETCQMHDWDSSVFCHNEAGVHTLIYVPAYRISNRTAGDSEMITICDECYDALGDGYGHRVKTVSDIRTTNDIVYQ